MKERPEGKLYSLGEEIFSAVTHGIGALFGAAATALLIVVAALNANIWGVVSGAVYGATLILLYSASTLYHAIPAQNAKRVLRVMDHCSIFLLIAGTYTPLLLVTLRGSGGWRLFGIVWGAAIIGIVLNAINLKKYSAVSLVCYVLMGWVVVFKWSAFTANMAKNGVILLMAGGIVYMLGIVFYLLKKFRYMHSVWHLFVIGGSVLHFLCILLYVMPVK